MEVTPSILTADFCKLGETLDDAVAAGINWIHMDVYFDFELRWDLGIKEKIYKCANLSQN